MSSSLSVAYYNEAFFKKSFRNIDKTRFFKPFNLYVRSFISKRGLSPQTLPEFRLWAIFEGKGEANVKKCKM